MQVIGILIVIGVLFYIFVATLPYLWWLWLILLGIGLYGIGSLRKEKTKTELPKKENDTSKDTA